MEALLAVWLEAAFPRTPGVLVAAAKIAPVEAAAMGACVAEAMGGRGGAAGANRGKRTDGTGGTDGTDRAEDAGGEEREKGVNGEVAAGGAIASAICLHLIAPTVWSATWFFMPVRQAPVAGRPPEAGAVRRPQGDGTTGAHSPLAAADVWRVPLMTAREALRALLHPHGDAAANAAARDRLACLLAACAAAGGGELAAAGDDGHALAGGGERGAMGARERAATSGPGRAAAEEAGHPSAEGSEHVSSRRTRGADLLGGSGAPSSPLRLLGGAPQVWPAFLDAWRDRADDARAITAQWIELEGAAGTTPTGATSPAGANAPPGTPDAASPAAATIRPAATGTPTAHDAAPSGPPATGARPPRLLRLVDATGDLTANYALPD